MGENSEQKINTNVDRHKNDKIPQAKTGDKLPIYLLAGIWLIFSSTVLIQCTRKPNRDEKRYSINSNIEIIADYQN